MRRIIAILSTIILITIFLTDTACASGKSIPILCYHNLNPTKSGWMNMTPAKFEAQIKWMLDSGYTIIPLKEAVAYLQGKRDSLPQKSIVVTVDDGWRSVYTYMYPIIKKYHVPVTLFIYPSAISESKSYLNWQELKELQQSGLFDVQSHTYDHPNFKVMKKRLSSEKYAQYVNMQMTKSKKILEEKLGTRVTLLAWPFGIYNDYLEKQAANAGYDMAFTIDYKAANRGFRAEAQPRFMIINSLSEKTVQGIIGLARS